MNKQTISRRQNPTSISRGLGRRLRQFVKFMTATKWWLSPIPLIIAIVAILAVGIGLRLAYALTTGGGTISFTTMGATYSQDFNTLASSGTSSALPTGWYFDETSTNANTLYTAGTGSSTTGDTYSFGSTGSSERAFGELRSN